MIKAVLFDFWGTLAFNSGNKEEWNSIMEIIGKKNRQQFRKLMFEWWFTNNKTEKEFFTKVCKELGLDKSNIDKLTNIWQSQYEYARIFRNTIDVLTKLKEEGYKLGLVTNTASYTKKILKKLNLEKFFDIVILSCDVGVTKPDTTIYNLAAKKLKLKPVECLFIGDEVTNDVGGPRKAGMKSFLINRKCHKEDNIQSLTGIFDLIYFFDKQ